MRYASLLLSLLLTVSAQAAPRRYLAGNPADVSPALHGPVLNLAGGSTDVDAALQAMIDAARGCTDCAARLDLVVLRASGDDDYNDYLLAMQGVDSVETLVLERREDAQSEAVIDAVRRAELVFFAGGDQCNYVRLVQGTPVARAIEALYARGGAIGGTSAGMAIMGAIAYDACTGSAKSPDVLADPWHASVSFSPGMFAWPHLGDTLTDTHFSARDRMGRLLGFLARELQQSDRRDSLLGIAADEKTSIVIDAAGVATVMGNGAGSGRAFFVLADHRPGAGETVARGQPLSFRGYRVWVVRAGERFDLAERGRNGPAHMTLDVVAGQLVGDPY